MGEGAPDLPRDWKELVDTDSLKLYCDSGNVVAGFLVRFEKHPEGWRYMFSWPNHDPTDGFNNKTDTGTQLFLAALRQAEHDIANK